MHLKKVSSRLQRRLMQKYGGNDDRDRDRGGYGGRDSYRDRDRDRGYGADSGPVRDFRNVDWYRDFGGGGGKDRGP